MRLISAALLSLMLTAPSTAQEALIDSVFRAHRHAINLRNGELSGPGLQSGLRIIFL